MLSSCARRFVVAHATRQNAARSRCDRVTPSSRRWFVPFNRQPQPSIAAEKDCSGRPFLSSQSQSQCLNLVASSQMGQMKWLSSGDDLPYHIVMGMPALSPTMESGTIAKWNVAEGDSFAAGDSLAVIETDKATIDFEAQDDGVVGKLLVPEGGEHDVGVPIVVMLEDEDDVAAFANFTPDAASAAGGGAGGA